MSSFHSAVGTLLSLVLQPELQRGPGIDPDGFVVQGAGFDPN